MKYRNKSRHKMLIQLQDEVKEIFPNQIFEVAENLSYSFLEEVIDRKPRVKKTQESPALHLADSIAPPVEEFKPEKKKKKVAKKSIAKEDTDGGDSTEA